MQWLFLGYLAKLKRDLGLAFGAHFQHDFSIKMFLFEYSINEQSFNVTLYFFLKISKKCVIMFLFRPLMDVINLKIFLGSACKAIADREKKRGRRKYTNLNIWKTKRAF